MSLNEFEVIRRYFTRPEKTRPDVVLGVGDDAAIVHPDPGFDLVIAADVLNEGIHFPKSTSPHAIGYKSLAVNLSDLAAMGAVPLWFTMTLSLPEVDEHWLAEFSRGLFEIADTHGIHLVGGDTVRGPLSIGIQVIGKVPGDLALRRDGARAGDLVYVSGRLGAAAASLVQLDGGGEIDTALRQRLDYPVPRVELGLKLLGVANSCIDISDGLFSDLLHILEASDKGARIQLDLLPLATELSSFKRDAALSMALTGGDEYELCFTVAKDKRQEIHDFGAALDCELTQIGQIVDGSGIELEGSESLPVDVLAGFDHFKE